MNHFSATTAIADQRRAEHEATAARRHLLREARQTQAGAGLYAEPAPRRWSITRIALALSA
jgi:hypothetical protein